MATYNISSPVKVDASAAPTTAAHLSSATWSPDTSPIRWGAPGLISAAVLREASGGDGGGDVVPRPQSGMIYPRR